MQNETQYNGNNLSSTELWGLLQIQPELKYQ